MFDQLANEFVRRGGGKFKRKRDNQQMSHPKLANQIDLVLRSRE